MLSFTTTMSFFFNWAKLFLKQKTADILAFGVFGGLVQLRFVVAVLSRGKLGVFTHS